MQVDLDGSTIKKKYFSTTQMSNFELQTAFASKMEKIQTFSPIEKNLFFFCFFLSHEIWLLKNYLQ
jgi:hypothetical protein